MPRTRGRRLFRAAGRAYSARRDCGFAILLDVIAAAVGGRLEGWNLHPEHFVERHGLFVIIALGETLIVAAGGVTGASWTGELVAITL
ncbi:MAG: low temperature requirement protein A, partial [Vicinamibacteria bacterium]